MGVISKKANENSVSERGGVKDLWGFGLIGVV